LLLLSHDLASDVPRESRHGELQRASPVLDALLAHDLPLIGIPPPDRIRAGVQPFDPNRFILHDAGRS
jgi:hypothetical protein